MFGLVWFMQFFDAEIFLYKKICERFHPAEKNARSQKKRYEIKKFKQRKDGGCILIIYSYTTQTHGSFFAFFSFFSSTKSKQVRLPPPLFHAFSFLASFAFLLWTWGFFGTYCTSLLETMLRFCVAFVYVHFWFFWFPHLV